MKLNEFLDGIEILRNHYGDRDGYQLGAEHDIIYLYPTTTPLTRDEVEKMHSLGWHQPEAPLDADGNWSPDGYDPTEGWGAFT